MIIDKRTTLADSVALNTGGAGTYLIGDVIDLGQARDIGNGNDHLYVYARVSTTCTSAGSATLNLQVVSDAQAAVAVDGSATVHIDMPTKAVADLSANEVIFIGRLPLEGNVYERYIGLLQITGTAAFTAGAVEVFMTPQAYAWKAYQEGQN
jgi:hypothetical protein